MDCSYSFGNLSCGGGLMDGAFGYYEVNKAMTEADYPYTASFHRVCSYDDSKAVSGTMISSYYDVVEDPDQLKAALNIAPVSVAIEADTTVFSSYVSGVITSASCGTNLDHGVLAVGYGTLDGDEFFLVKNSWGASWGDEGYVRIGVASGAGICGINSSASQPTL
jgi:cathepsin L